MKLSTTVALLSLSSLAWGNAGTSAFVPNGKILSQSKAEIKVQTPAGTTVELEFLKNGELEEASGTSAEKGDVFDPGNKLISLDGAVTAIKKLGKTLQGEWTFEESLKFGPVYTFEGIEKGKQVDFTVSAQDGKLLETEVDE